MFVNPYRILIGVFKRMIFSFWPIAAFLARAFLVYGHQCVWVRFKMATVGCGNEINSSVSSVEISVRLPLWDSPSRHSSKLTRTGSLTVLKEGLKLMTKRISSGDAVFTVSSSLSVNSRIPPDSVRARSTPRPPGPHHVIPTYCTRGLTKHNTYVDNLRTFRMYRLLHFKWYTFV